MIMLTVTRRVFLFVAGIFFLSFPTTLNSITILMFLKNTALSNGPCQIHKDILAPYCKIHQFGTRIRISNEFVHIIWQQLLFLHSPFYQSPTMSLSLSLSILCSLLSDTLVHTYIQIKYSNSFICNFYIAKYAFLIS